MKKGNIFKQTLLVLLGMTLLAPLQALGQSSGGETQGTFKKEELAQILAPMALYPDPLIAQMLMAATYPLEVVEADRFVKANPDLKGDPLDAALKEEAWDVSVKSLCHFPQVVSTMSEKLDWTTKLGDAFLAQQAEVMDMIQELRAKAYVEGNLKTTAEQKVIVEEKYIVIEPADPQVIYVPTYSTTVVYGAWWYPAYPPYVWYYPPGRGRLGFGLGIGVGIGVSRWARCGWGRRNIDIDINRTANFNKNVHRGSRPGGKQKWQHNRNHRRAAYRDRNTSQRFGQSPNRSVERRREARGYGDRGGLDRKTRDSMKKQGFDRGTPGSRGEGGLNRHTRKSSKKQGADRGSLSSRKGSGRKSSSAFSGSRSGKSSRMSSHRGRSSRGSSSKGSRGGGSSRGGGRRGGGRR